ncbi:hypothetical protein D9M73_151860 [compost metagenome]
MGQRRSSNATASAPAPIARLAPFHPGIWATVTASCDSTLPSPGATPVVAINWRSTMLAASPIAKPRSTGRETNAATKPSRSAPATRNNSPTSPTITTAASNRCDGSTMASDAVAAASVAADAEVGATMATRLRPTSA